MIKALLPLFLLVFLASMWGGSFLFMSISVNELGPLFLNFLRLIIAASLFLPVWFFKSFRKSLRQYWRQYVVVGIFNYAVPYTLLSVATLHLSSGTTSLLNAATPIATALISWIWLKHQLSHIQWFGLMLAFFGIYLIGSSNMGVQSIWSVIAAILATFSYAFTINYIKQTINGHNALHLATGSLFFSAIFMSGISLFIEWPDHVISQQSWLAVIGLSVVCTSLALIIYFYLINTIGTVSSASVTFLVPMFAITWGVIWLKESFTLNTALNMLLVLVGVGLVLLPDIKKAIKEFKLGAK